MRVAPLHVRLALDFAKYVNLLMCKAVLNVLETILILLIVTVLLVCMMTTQMIVKVAVFNVGPAKHRQIIVLLVEVIEI